MGEREGRAPTPPLFDPIPKKLREQEGHIKDTYDGSIGSDGIIMSLNPITGAPIMAVFVDLFDKAGKKHYEPLKRGKWSSHNHQDIKPGSHEFDKLGAIEEAVRAKWLEWKTANPNHKPIREFRTSLIPSAQIPIRREPEPLFIAKSPHADKPKQKGKKQTPKVTLNNDAAGSFASHEGKPIIEFPETTPPEAVEAYDGDIASIREIVLNSRIQDVFTHEEIPLIGYQEDPDPEIVERTNRDIENARRIIAAREAIEKATRKQNKKKHKS